MYMRHYEDFADYALYALPTAPGGNVAPRLRVVARWHVGGHTFQMRRAGRVWGLGRCPAAMQAHRWSGLWSAVGAEEPQEIELIGEEP